jgi:hypothetical protein
MSAKVDLNSWGQWVGVCKDCKATISGLMSGVDLWADVHNQENHSEVGS